MSTPHQSEKIRLTQFSPGAGCGCKIAPKVLEEILQKSKSGITFEKLLVGNDSKDDAAVFDIGGGRSVISTTDFFTPIVDDPFNFGRISATNAISDIYAMGGEPLMAIAILGWPLEKLPASVAGEVVSGARTVCESAGIPLAGGHSISCADPIFGLAVTGIIETSKVKRNDRGAAGSVIFLTKPLGIGLVSSAEKFNVVREADRIAALDLMTTLNVAGKSLADIEGVVAMTDVTGFGLLGHAIEMAEGSGLKAVIDYNLIPKIEGVDYYIEQECMPGGTYRNFASYGEKVSPISEKVKALLCDPQTSGGLLVAVRPEAVAEVEALSAEKGFPLFRIGTLEVKNGEHFAEIINT